eukprot:Amastigsp_a844256_9.p3 type:complete len:113 gc:universal Amastigsp_a844256_9:1036-698(-)
MSMTGLTSTTSMWTMPPCAPIISIARCPSRKVRPPSTGVPTPGASDGSIESMSNERQNLSPPAGAATARAISIQRCMPSLSIEDIVNRLRPSTKPKRRSVTRSPASTSRIPT